MTFLLMNWRWVLLATLIATNALTFKLWRGAVEDLTVFKAQVEAIGEQAKKDKERIEAENKLNKEKVDANHKRTTANLRADIARLRNNGGQGGLSAPAPTTGSPETTCLDRPKFDTALRSLDQGVLTILEGCGQAVIDLDAAKEWAKGIR